MRLKTKNTNIFHAQTTKNTKNKTTKKKKQTTTTKQTSLLLLFISHSRPLYSSHTTHHPTHNTHQKVLITRGDSLEQQYLCCSRHPTACHKTKQTIKQSLNTNTLILVSLIPPHAHTTTCGTCFHPKTKNLATTRRPNQTPNNDKNLPPARY